MTILQVINMTIVADGGVAAPRSHVCAQRGYECLCISCVTSLAMGAFKPNSVIQLTAVAMSKRRYIF